MKTEMNIRTHERTDQGLCGTPVKLSPGYSMVKLQTTARMAVDNHGLIHGGFIFGLADYAAMIAVNDPNVALGAAEVKFLKPVAVDEQVMAEASLLSEDGRKRMVRVIVVCGDTKVFEGSFTCFVLEKHVLD